LAVPVPVLRLHSDDQLVALFRSGSDDAFRAIHDRYRVRLLAYASQMLGGSRADAEDALQDVFVRAHQALRANRQPIMLRAWLYRIAHNRCVDQLRRPAPIPSEILPGAQLALSRGARHDPPAEAERSEDLRRLVADVHSLPEQQRSALLMRELQGLSYEELGCALGISVAGVKSLLLRARGGVLDAAAARDTPCSDIRIELASAHDRGVRASGRARRHMRECDQCSSYRGELRSLSRQVAALVPAGPLGHLGLLFGIGGGGGAGAGAGAGGSIAAGSSSALLGGAASVTATKVAVLVCACALVGGAGALQVSAGPSSPPAHKHAARAHAARHEVSSAAVENPRYIAQTAGGTIAPAPVSTPAPTPRPASASTAAPPLVASPLSGEDQLSLSGVGDDQGTQPGLSPATTGLDPASTLPTTATTLPGAAITLPGSATTTTATLPAGTQTAGQTAPAGSDAATGSAGSATAGTTPDATQGVAPTSATSSSSATQPSAAAGSSTADSSPASAATAGGTTTSVGTPVTTTAVQSGPGVSPAQPVDRYSRNAASVHNLHGVRFAGGAAPAGALMVFWQHRSHGSAPLHHASPEQHYLSLTSAVSVSGSAAPASASSQP
jgi:RNA polymerase sigma factor (sigma-70 family)